MTDVREEAAPVLLKALFLRHCTLSDLLRKEMTEQLDEFLQILYCVIYAFYTSNPDWFMALPQGEVNDLSKSSEMKMKYTRPSCDSE